MVRLLANLKMKIFLNSIVLLMLAGCASLNQKQKEVLFSKTSYMLKYKTIEPDSYEKEGLKFRLYQQNKVLKYTDTLQVFTQITGKKGKELKIDKIRKVIFSPGTSIDNFLITTETNSKDLTETSTEKLLMSNRGEIIKFFKGEHLSKNGLIKILTWTRTPVFPKKAIKIGDSWSYEETMKVKLESFWITRKVKGPDKIKVNCKLIGFVELKGHRCAVIEARVVNRKNEAYTAFFKTMKLQIRTYLSEKIFFDYKRGLELGRISTTNSFTSSDDNKFSDTSKSQAVSILDER